jgi:hypothetical protein
MAVPDRLSCSRGEAGSQSVTHHTVLERLPDFSCISWACAFRAEDGESIFFCGPVEAEGGTSALSRRASSSGISWRIFSLVKWTIHRHERERLVTALTVMTKSRAPAGGTNYPGNCLMKPSRRDTRALSPAGMSRGKASLRRAAQKSRRHAPLAPMRSKPAYFICKWGEQISQN